MSTPAYLAPGLTLSPSDTFSSQVQALQRDLRALGYGRGPFDGIYGPGTTTAIEALQWDLLNNSGASTAIPGDGTAPVAVKNYNQGAVTAVTGVMDQNVAACIAAMVADPAYPKLPASSDAAADNAAALAALSQIPSVPAPFLIAVLHQESGGQHYHVPGTPGDDSFVTIGLDRNNSAHASAITSRGFGIGQYTLFHHPPTADEVAGVITDPVKNVASAVALLQEKFDKFLTGASPDDQASDRLAEVGDGPLRPCQFDSTDARYMKVCTQCMTAAGAANIVSGVTPCYGGCSDDYGKTQYHVGSYNNVPIRAKIPCDWPYAIRRYNGSGTNSYDYQAEVLLRIVQL